MTQIRHIRKTVFSMSQAAFGQVAGVDQATVSKWERGVCVPSQREMARIRQYAIDHGIPWDDSYFFEVPAEQAEAAAP